MVVFPAKKKKWFCSDQGILAVIDPENLQAIGDEETIG